MAIVIDEKNKVFTLQTKASTYQMKVDDFGTLRHTYYGKKTDNSDKSNLYYTIDRGFSGNPYDMGMIDRAYSLDLLPQEYSCFGTGDHRITALKVQHADGSEAAELRYKSYAILNKKYSMKGLPAVYAEEGETLVILLEDPYTNLQVELYYGILEELDVITRAVKIKNAGTKAVVLQKAASMNLDMYAGDFEWMTLCGRYALERSMYRQPISHGVQSVGSVRGASSHQYHPFAILCEKETTETMGECYGISFVYSGEFLLEIEKDHIDQTRVLCGIHPDSFAWELGKNEEFWTPEVILSYSSEGFGKLRRMER